MVGTRPKQCTLKIKGNMGPRRTEGGGAPPPIGVVISSVPPTVLDAPTHRTKDGVLLPARHLQRTQLTPPTSTTPASGRSPWQPCEDPTTVSPAPHSGSEQGAHSVAQHPSSERAPPGLAPKKACDQKDGRPRATIEIFLASPRSACATASPRAALARLSPRITQPQNPSCLCQLGPLPEGSIPC